RAGSNTVQCLEAAKFGPSSTRSRAGNMSEPGMGAVRAGRRQTDRRPHYGTIKGAAVMKSDSKVTASLDPAALAERFQTLATKSQAAVQGLLAGQPDVANIGMGDPAKIGQAFFELAIKLWADPRPVVRAQIEFWEQSVSLWARTSRHLLGGEPPPATAQDKRFKHPEWADN